MPINLKYVKGDLVKAAYDGKINVFAHQANCFCTAKNGIAPQIFKKFPALERADMRTQKGRREKMGRASHAFCWSPNVNKGFVWGFNIYGQYHNEKDNEEYCTIYSALQSGLEEMRDIIMTRKTLHWEWDEPLKVGFPLIGCGRAGGNWNIVEEMIKEVFSDLDFCTFYVYTINTIKGKEYVLNQ